MPNWVIKLLNHGNNSKAIFTISTSIFCLDEWRRMRERERTHGEEGGVIPDGALEKALCAEGDVEGVGPHVVHEILIEEDPFRIAAVRGNESGKDGAFEIIYPGYAKPVKQVFHHHQLRFRLLSVFHLLYLQLNNTHTANERASE